MRVIRSVCLVSSLALMACHSSTGTQEQRVIGTIDAGNTLERVIQAPAAASNGRSFAITVSTFGNSCVASAGADLTIDGLIATITPYDVIADGTCLDYLKPYPRALELRFDGVGTATIRVRGRSFYQPGLVVTERSLTVGQ